MNNKLLLAGANRLALCIALAAFAGAVSAEKRVLEEVIVTAQKKAQSLQDVPVSVSTIGGDMAAEAAIVDASDLVQYTPNVKFTAANPIYSSTSIRGFGTPPLARALEPSVGLVIDGVSYGRSTFTNDGVFDLERLEVLRGPQGTLFGKNTIAGVLNFSTKRPSFELEGYVNAGIDKVAGWEQMAGYRYEAAIGFPIIEDTLAGRISWRKRDRSFFLFNTARDNEEEGFSDESMRIKLDWFVSETVELRFIAFKSEFEGVGNNAQHSTTTETGLRVYREEDPQTEDDEFNHTRSSNAATETNRLSESIALKAIIATGDLWAFRNSSVDIIANWAEISTPFALDTDFGPLDAGRTTSDGPEIYEQEQLELRFSADTDPFFGWGDSIDWTLGAFASKTTARTSQDSFVNVAGIAAGAPIIAEARGAPENPTPEQLVALGFSPAFATVLATGAIPGGSSTFTVLNFVETDAETLALFGQMDWHLSDSLTSTFGLRLGKETKQGHNGSFSSSPVPSLLIGQENFDNVSSRKEYEVTPKLALSWAMTDEINVFGNITKGFKSGGYSGPLIAPNNVEYEPEEAISAEIGLKTRLFDQTLDFNITAYHVDFEGLQLIVRDSVQASTANIDEASSYGLEIDFQWLPPVPFWTVSGSVGFNRTRYGDFPCGPTTFRDRDAAPECGEDAAPSQDLSGERLAFVPEKSASLMNTFKFPIWPSKEIGGMFGIDVIYQGDQYLDYDLDENTYQEATTKINARLAIAPIDRRWALVFNAKNLTEEQEKLLVLDIGQQDGNYTAFTKSDEAEYSIDFRYNFGTLE